MTRVSTDTGHKISISPGAKGALSEHIATAWLLRQGFDVFRNVSPNGRADLLAVDWVKDKTIRVDVKSKGFTLVGSSPRAGQARERDKLNQGFDIKYLVVGDDGDCQWYKDEPMAANDNQPQPMWWTDMKSGQRFLLPGNDMPRKQWTYFCHWLLRAYPKHIHPVSEDFVRDISARGIGNDRPHVSAVEFVVLEKLRRQVFEKLSEQGAIKSSGAAA